VILEHYLYQWIQVLLIQLLNEENEQPFPPINLGYVAASIPSDNTKIIGALHKYDHNLKETIKQAEELEIRDVARLREEIATEISAYLR